MSQQQQPYFRHHCPDCSHLGSADINGRKLDFYHCGKTYCDKGTILWRESDEESDYGSCPISQITALNKCAILGLNLWLEKRGLKGWNGFRLEGAATLSNGSFSISPDKTALVECMERLRATIILGPVDAAKIELAELAMMILPDNMKREFCSRL